METMRILARTERSPREAYTGSIGYITPVRQARFNVAIRTVIVDQQTGAASRATRRQNRSIKSVCLRFVLPSSIISPFSFWKC